MSARLLRVLTNIGWVAAMLAGLRAQEVSIADHDDAGRQTCAVRMLACFGSQQVGGLGFVRVEIDGSDDRPHQFELEIGVPTWNQIDVNATRHLRLGPGERARFFVPVPSSLYVPRYRFVVDRREVQEAFSAARAPGLAGLLVSDRTDAVPDAMAVLNQVPTSDRSTPSLAQCQPMDLPTDWRLFTSFHVLIVDGRAALASDLQEALRRFVFAGGAVVVATPEQLPAGPLRDLLPLGSFGDVVAHGFGACVAIPRLDSTNDVLKQRVGSLPYVGKSPWPADISSEVPLAVPGLGQPPVLVFLSIIIAFAVIAGPVNLIWSRRRRQPLLMLVTLPVLGFGTTLVILAYGYLHDGVGLRGSEISWSLLDQTRHEVAAVASRTLFAGIAPDELQLSPDTFLTSARAFRPSGRAIDRWRLDLDQDRLDGAVVPSRTPTPLLVRQQGTARERLRVHRIGQGLEVLVDGGVAPIGAMVLRDLDGSFWVGESPKLLAANPAQVAATLAQLRRQATAIALDGALEYGRTMSQTQSAGEIVQRMFPGDSLQPGSYAAMVGKAPWLAEHGLTVHYDSERHFVLGRMQAEDFLP